MERDASSNNDLGYLKSACVLPDIIVLTRLKVDSNPMRRRNFLASFAAATVARSGPSASPNILLSIE